MRYVKIETTSDRHKDVIPSTPGQWDLLNLLKDELKELGITDVSLDKHGYLIASMESNIDDVSQPPVIGFMAHVDTSEDVSGKNVKPLLHKKYDGKDIQLTEDVTISVKESPELKRYKGETVITADGTTLLGADNKAGIAEIMTAAAWYLKNDREKHGKIEIIFTPDEETGKGLDRFPIEKLNSFCCYTIDGDIAGTIEAECFHGYKAEIVFNGIVIHPGDARGKLMNAITMASNFISMLPRNESPEATDGRLGFYCPLGLSGGIEKTEFELLIRDFEYEEVKRRIETVKQIAKAVEGMYPGGSVEVSIHKQYSNMRDFLDKDPRIIRFLEKALEKEDMKPLKKIIRGGTDGARLSEMGIPTPNVFTGGTNFHSKREWIAIPGMIRSVRSIVQLIRLWSEER